MFSLPDDFFEKNWRKWPLHLPGSAPAFLASPPTRDDFLAAIADGMPVQSDGSTVWFLEGTTDGFSGFAELVRKSRQFFEWHDIWCDVFVTSGPSSIGCHYDGSDNFSIQLAGNKKWFLSPPDAIHPDDRRRRLLGEPGLGPAPVPDRVLTFSLGAGDVLYIPSTWVHWGVSDGDSTSVSLVINVASALHVLEAHLIDSLRRDERWSAPLPVGPGSASARDTVLRSLVRQDLTSRVYRDVMRRIPDREGTRLSAKILPPAAEPAGGQPDRTQGMHADGTADAERLAADIASGAKDIEAIVAQALGALRQRNLARLHRQCEVRATQTTNADARRIYYALSANLATVPPDVLSELLICPEICSWLNVAERGVRSIPRPRAEDPLADALGLTLLPELAAFSAGSEPIAVTVPADEDGGLTLRRCGLKLTFSHRPRRVSLAGLDGSLHYLGRDAATSIAVQPDVIYDRDCRVGIRLLPRLSADGAVVSTASTDWLDRAYGHKVAGSPLDRTAFEHRAGQVLAAARQGGRRPSRDPFLSWVLIRGGAVDVQPAELTRAGLTGLAIVTQEDRTDIALALAAARAGHEFDALADFSPVTVASITAAERARVRNGLRTSFAFARVPAMAADPSSAEARPDESVLTPWGLALLAHVTGSERHSVRR